MKIKVSKATGIQLDWLVAKAQGFEVYHSALLNGYIKHGFWVSGYHDDLNNWVPLVALTYSTSWAQGGPIIERERISPGYSVEGDWIAYRFDPQDELEASFVQRGPTTLIAAMRCFICSRLGETVEIPEELCQ